MKIAYLVNHMDVHGGIEKITTQKINAWIELYGYEVVLITKKKDFNDFVYPLHKKCKHINLQIYNKPGRKYLKNVINYFRFKNRLESIIKEEGIDVLFTTLTSIDALIVPYVAKKIPKVLEFHQSGIFITKNTWRFKKLFLEKYHTIVLLNEDEVQYYNLPNYTVIPNFISKTDTLQNSEVSRTKIIIAAGRIDDIKQFDHLIEIWSGIAVQNPEWEFNIFGNGSEDVRHKLLTLVRNYKLEESFKIFPAIDDLATKFREASVFVQTSASECFPMVILEAMQAGLPVVTYDSPNGPRNIITSGKDGILVPLNNKEKFREVLNDVLSDPNLRLDLVKNQKEKLDKFSEKIIMQRWKELVLRLTKM